MQKNIIAFTVLALALFNRNGIAQQPIPSQYVNPVINYVRTWDAIKPTTDANAIVGYDVQDVRMTTQYLDGLGRPLQTVVKKGSLATSPANPSSAVNASDIVSTNVYDPLGREAVKYLPYADVGNNGLFKINPFNPQVGFYNTQLNGQLNETSANSTTANWAYSQTNFEASPLNRPQETFAPGVSWVGSSGQTPEAARKSVKVKYWTNTADDAVRVWIVGSTSLGSFANYTSTITYGAGQLYKNVMVDEHGKQLIEFKDKEGKVILKKVQIGNTADNGNGVGHTIDWLCTYYIYDDLNQLRCVIQPEAVSRMSSPTPNWSLTAYLDEQCFRYEYDHRGRMILKKVPGAGYVEMIYDTKDRLAMVQDAKMRDGSPMTYLYYQYDNHNRQVASATFESYYNALHHRTEAALQENYPSNLLAGTPSEYLLTKTHYDDYANLPSGLSAFSNAYIAHFSTQYTQWPYPQVVAPATSIRGQVGWTSTRILGSSNFIYAVNYYDDKGRVIQIQSTNATGGLDIITTQYSWTGQPLYIVQKHEKSGTNPQTSVVVTKLSYDALGRVIGTEKKQSNTLLSGNVMSNYATISTMQYDALGQLKNKAIGSKKDPSNPTQYLNPRQTLQDLTFDYNIRGWMLGMNRNYLSTEGQTSDGKLFGFELGYDKPGSTSGRNFTGNGEFNGNIRGMIWKSDGDDTRRKYDFVYDAANRLLKGEFEQHNSDDHNWNNTQVNYNVKIGNGADPSTAYDANGNIKQMQHWGLGLSNSSQIDDLRYDYYPGSNKLKVVVDVNNIPTTTLGDFRTSANHPDASIKNIGNIANITDYYYDPNGNLVKDCNKDIGSSANNGITYNHLNLPSQVAVYNGPGVEKGTITYTYDASGNKLEKTTVEKGVTIHHNGTSYPGITVTSKTKYVAGFIYESKAYNDAGRSTNATLTTALAYTDKLLFSGQEEGRTRATYTEGVTASAYTMSGLEYDYMIKDHLGNVRMVITEEIKPMAVYQATIEDVARPFEIQLFNKIPDTEFLKPTTPSPGFDSDGSNAKVAKLFNTSGSDKRIGPGVVLKVMAGDKVNAKVKAWYPPSATDNTVYTGAPALINSLIGVLSGGLVSSGSKGTLAELGNTSGVLNAPLTSLLNDPGRPYTSSRPKAYLNWILLDEEQFKYVSANNNSGAAQIQSIGSGEQCKLAQTNSGSDISITKNGYIYIFVSNESQGAVYFDDLRVEHKAGVLLEETHYYPFGLTMAGISSKGLGKLENNYRYSGKELQSKEFSSLGIELYDFHARQQDPQLGRFWQIDPKCELFPHYNPYNYCYNNPMLFIDPDGMKAFYNWDDGKYYDEGREVGFDEVQQQYGIGKYSSNFSVMVIGKDKPGGKNQLIGDHNENTLWQIMDAAKKEGNMKVIQAGNADDAADQIEDISGKINNLFFASHGDAQNSQGGKHQAYFAIGGQNFQAKDIAGSTALERIARKLASTPGPLPSAAEVIIFSCGAGGTYNGGVQLLGALAKKLHATIYGPQGFGMGWGGYLFKNKPGSQQIPVAKDPNIYSNALRNHGNWTRVYEYGSSYQTQTVRDVYFDAFGRIHYTQ